MTHLLSTWFRERGGRIHWRCGVCGLSYEGDPPSLPPGACDCIPRANATPLPWGDQLGYIVREAWCEWARAQPNPKPHWLEPYEELSAADQAADRQIGEAVLEFVVTAMQQYRQVAITEGELCQRLGMGRINVRMLLASLGVEQVEEG